MGGGKGPETRPDMICAGLLCALALCVTCSAVFGSGALGAADGGQTSPGAHDGPSHSHYVLRSWGWFPSSLPDSDGPLCMSNRHCEVTLPRLTAAFTAIRSGYV